MNTLHSFCRDQNASLVHAEGMKWPSTAWLVLALFGFSCSTDSQSGPQETTQSGSTAPNEASLSTTATVGSGTGAESFEPATAPVQGTEGLVLPPSAQEDASVPVTCASSTARAELQGIELAFAFDVSGSMGKGDEPYHDRQLKWDPVVEASLSFFESEAIERVSASLVFFPTDADEDERCDVSSYARPDVELQELPSTDFRSAIVAITPEDEDDWRGGTPTLAVLRATIGRVNNLDAGVTSNKRAVVLVTDGTPQGCSEEDDSIDNLANTVSELRKEVPVYVVGVANPITEEEPDPPDNVSSLDLIAQAGGTNLPFLINTGDPQATIAAFSQAINSIRNQALSCEVAIPDPPTGMTLDINKVNVTVTSDGNVSALVYSEDCADPEAWRFDDEESPSAITLCPASCERTKSMQAATLDVEFGCERRVSDVR
jgi:hypothetical protein